MKCNFLARFDEGRTHYHWLDRINKCIRNENVEFGRIAQLKFFTNYNFLQMPKTKFCITISYSGITGNLRLSSRLSLTTSFTRPKRSWIFV
jgi:hypothetical protein